MSAAPLDRDMQIALMSNTKERLNRLMDKWVSDATVRRALSEPAEGQKTAYRSQTIKAANS